jgi:hypothetical protein
VPQQPAGGTKEDFAAALNENALALPCVQQAARGERRDVGLVGQFLIPDVEFDASWDFLTDPFCKVSEYLSEPLRGGVADQRGVYPPISCQVIKGD